MAWHQIDGEWHDLPDDVTPEEMNRLFPPKPAQGAPKKFGALELLGEHIGLGALIPGDREGRQAHIKGTAEKYRADNPMLTGAGDTISRVVTNANPVLGAGDLGAAAYNIGKGYISAPGDLPDMPYPSAAVRGAAGIPELPADASIGRRIAEGTGSALLGNPKSLVGDAFDVGKSVVRAGTDVTLAEGGARAGEAIGGALGDSQLGSLLGAITGALTRPVVQSGAGRLASNYGNSQAGEIFDATRRATGENPTAGMVGTPGVASMEKAAGSFPFGSGPVQGARDRVRTGLEGAAGEAATAIRGGPAAETPVLPGHVGQAVTDAAAAERGLSFDYAKANADNLGRTMAGRPVPLDPVDAGMAEVNAAGRGLPELTDLGQWYERLQNERPPAPVLVPGQPAGPPIPHFAVNPVPGPDGTLSSVFTHNLPGTPAVPPVMGPQPNTVPWEVMQNTKQSIGAGTAAGKPFDQRLSDILYGGIKDAERAAANSVPGANGLFDRASEAYATNIGKNGVVDRLNPLAGGFDPKTGKPIADPTLKNYEMLKRGMRAPGAMDVFANDVPVEAAGPAFGNLVDTLGRPATPGTDFTFSPQKFAKEWDATMPESRDIATRTAPGARQRLDDVATAGRAYDLPPQAQGLSRALGALATMVQGGGLLNIPGAAVAAIPYGIGKTMESDAFVRSLAGRYMSLTERLRQSGAAPLAAVTSSQQ